MIKNVLEPFASKFYDQHQTNKIKVLIVVNQVIFRDALTRILEEDKIFTVLDFQYSSYDQFDITKINECDVIIMDLDLNEANAFEVISEITAKTNTKIIAMAHQLRPGAVKRYIEVGLSSVITYRNSYVSLKYLILAAHHGAFYLDEFSSRAITQVKPCPLNPSELKVLDLLRQSTPVDSIGPILGVPQSSVVSKISSTRKKLSVKTNVHAFSKAWDEGWI